MRRLVSPGHGSALFEFRLMLAGLRWWVGGATCLSSAVRELLASTLKPFISTRVCTENLNPNVLMMKSAQDSVRTYDAGSPMKGFLIGLVCMILALFNTWRRFLEPLSFCLFWVAV